MAGIGQEIGALKREIKYSPLTEEDKETANLYLDEILRMENGGVARVTKKHPVRGAIVFNVLPIVEAVFSYIWKVLVALSYMGLGFGFSSVLVAYWLGRSAEGTSVAPYVQWFIWSGVEPWFYWVWFISLGVGIPVLSCHWGFKLMQGFINALIWTVCRLRLKYAGQRI